MVQTSNFNWHATAHLASLTLYFLATKDLQGYCSSTLIVSTSILGYVTSNWEEHRRIAPQTRILYFKGSIAAIGVGCLLSRVGVKVWGLSLLYFGVTYNGIHQYRPKEVYLPRLPRRYVPPRKKMKPLEQSSSSPSQQTKAPSSTPTSEQITRMSNKDFLEFYKKGNIKGNNQFSFDEILKFNDAEMEKHHNFIQWLFPIETQSKYVSNELLLNNEIVQAFKNHEAFKSNQKRAFKRMLGHYGLRLTDDSKVVKGQNFAEKKKYISGHNLKRITRILKSLSSLGQPQLAQAFLSCLKELAQNGMKDELGLSLETYWKPVLIRIKGKNK